MKPAQLFLFDLLGLDRQANDAIEEALSRSAPLLPLRRLRVEPGVLDGTDGPVEGLLEEIRAVTAAVQTSPDGVESSDSEASADAVLVGLGLAGSLCLWMNVLDKVRPRRFSTRNFSIDLIDAPVERGPTLRGTIAIDPLLGLDFSAHSAAPVPGQRAAEWLYSLAGTPALGALFGRFKTDFGRYGCPLLEQADWATIRRSLPFSSVVKFLPSLKRPAIMIFDEPLSQDFLSIRLGSLHSRVSVMTSSSDVRPRVEAILRAVDRINKGAEEGNA